MTSPLAQIALRRGSFGEVGVMEFGLYAAGGTGSMVTCIAAAAAAQGYHVNSDEFNYNYGQAKAAVGQYNDAIEVWAPSIRNSIIGVVVGLLVMVWA